MGVQIDDQLLAVWGFYSAVLVLKMLLMSPLTARQRFAKGVFANPEDTKMDPKKCKVRYDDDDVERVRRAHLNDMENILPFFAISFAFILTNPVLSTTKLLFQIFTGARILHTIVYAIVPLPQPSRALAWGVGMAVNVYLGVKVLTHFM